MHWLWFFADSVGAGAHFVGGYGKEFVDSVGAGAHFIGGYGKEFEHFARAIRQYRAKALLAHFVECFFVVGMVIGHFGAMGTVADQLGRQGQLVSMQSFGWSEPTSLGTSSSAWSSGRHFGARIIPHTSSLLKVRWASSLGAPGSLNR